MTNPLFRLLLSALYVAGVAGSARGESADPIAKFVGAWDLVGTNKSIRILPDHTVEHSILGRGDIQHDRVDYYKVIYRHRSLLCNYEIKQYKKDSLSFATGIDQDSPDCQLGTMTRAPEPESDDAAAQKVNDAGASKKDQGNAATRPASAKVEAALPPTSVIKDCADGCPDLVIAPAGDFLMGSPESEVGRRLTEGPLHKVSFAATFAVGRYAVTVDEFKAFVAATGFRAGAGCTDTRDQTRPELSFTNPGFAQTGRQPVVCVSFNDATEYAKWLSTKTGKPYRLLSEAEREYIAKAGSATAYPWGTTVAEGQANYNSAAVGPAVASKKRAGTVAVDAMQPNIWGFYHVNGNVEEWVLDCWNPNYTGAPADGTAAVTGDCSRHVLRGGSWDDKPTDIRSSYRDVQPAGISGNPSDQRYTVVGFRVARALDR